MKNIEIKATCPDLEAARNVVRRLDAHYEATYHQVDTYFQVHHGRLKLRQFDAHPAQLIYYERPDVANPKASEYEIYTVRDTKLKLMLSTALGIWKTVDKIREVYWAENVRIHLDQVQGLGEFLELEGVVSEKHSVADTEDKVKQLMDALNISQTALITGSYSDLLQSA